MQAFRKYRTESKSVIAKAEYEHLQAGFNAVQRLREHDLLHINHP